MFLFKVIKKLIYYFFSFLELFFLSKLVQLLLLFIFFISTFPLCLIRGNDRRRIFFGTDPIINNILWSKSLKDKIDRSDSVVHFHDDSFIAKAKDYDYIIEFYFFKFPKTYNQKILSLYAILNSIIIYYKYDFFGFPSMADHSIKLFWGGLRYYG